MGSGCGNSIVENPSSSGQLPVPVALNAPYPTLFAVIIHDCVGKVNTFLQNTEIFSSKAVAQFSFPGASFAMFPISRTVKWISASTKEEGQCNAKS